MNSQFGDLVASELFCPRCRRSQPVRERLLLVLPSGDLYEYVCRQCGDSLGEKTTTSAQPFSSAPAPAPRPGQRRLLS